MHKPTTSPVTLYVTKRFTAGLLAGMDVLDSMPFATVEKAWAWAQRHREQPVRGFCGARYLVVDASFQAYAR